MTTSTDFWQTADLRFYVVWVLSLVLVATGFRYARRLIAFLLEKLYQIFIQQGQGA